MDHLYVMFYLKYNNKLIPLHTYPKLVYTEGEALEYANKKFKNSITRETPLVAKFYKYSHTYVEE